MVNRLNCFFSSVINSFVAITAAVSTALVIRDDLIS